MQYLKWQKYFPTNIIEQSQGVRSKESIMTTKKH